MRVTRAASRAELAQHVDDETHDASNPYTDIKDRVPLGEVSANAALDSDPTDAPTKKMAVKKGKAKGAAKKGAKGKKAKAAQEEHVDVDPAPDDERQAAGSPASDAAVDELADAPTADTAQAPLHDERPSTPPSRAVRMTRRQLAKQEEDLSRSLRSRGPPQPEPLEEDATAAAQGPSVSESHQLEEKVEEIAATQSHPEPATESSEEPSEEAREDSVLESSRESLVEATEVQERPVVEGQEDIVGQDEVEVEGPVVTARVEDSAPTAFDIPEPEIGTPSVEVTEPEPKVLTSENPLEEDLTPATSLTPSRALSRSSSRSASKTPMRLEESIGAIDALEEALENVGGSLPSFDQLTDDKSPRKARFTRTATPSSTPRKSTDRQSMSPKVSRNPSLPPRSMKSTGLSRASSVRAPPKERTVSGEVTDYLASRRRPISMTFAPPPPAAKSTKAPTTSSFQLPGERVAAELKAKKEERLKRMAGAGPVKQRPLSMPPPPKSNKPPTKSDFQLPGERIAAELKAKKEERLKRQAEGEAIAPRQVNLPAPPKSSKPPTVPNFQLPGEKFAAEQKARKEERLKREAGDAEATKKAPFKARPAPVRKSIVAPVRQTAVGQARERLMAKENTFDPIVQPLQRGSIVQARSVSTSSSTRNSVVANSGPVKLAPMDAAALKNKGREVFNRDKLEKQAREKERREKEEAAKKARAEAAERGRIASREWAKKQMEKREEAARKVREGLP